MIDTQVDSSARIRSLNMTTGCGAAGDALGVAIANGATNGPCFSTLFSGIVGSLASYYVPVNHLQGSIQIRITFSCNFMQVNRLPMFILQVMLLF